MREILFRGKPKNEADYQLFSQTWNDNCKDGFVYGSLVVSKKKVYICVSALCQKNSLINNGITTMIEVIPETVGQHTGLTDSNGKGIFEGDIIRYTDECEYRCYLESLECPEEYEGVDFSDLWTVDEVVYGIAIGYPAFDLNSHDWEENGLSHLHESRQYFYEVIGNTHDNPELLKGGEQE